jgi:hypothetical protein
MNETLLDVPHKKHLTILCAIAVFAILFATFGHSIIFHQIGLRGCQAQMGLRSAAQVLS